ncbi:hypothetical protein CASFOL_006219 [Castilleja foliolosa]|uniref:Coilin n=1 Tax=Castilleja foliolosa TaxID=1961234 RepID=A0ABD3E6T0_9LAMI
MEDKRIRLVFKDDDILNETQKSDGLKRSWVLLKPQQHDTVSDVASHLLRAYQLHQSCPNGLLLSMSGFVLPSFESTQILKDNEIIRVQKRRDILAIAGNNAPCNHNPVEKLKAVEKQPESSGVLLLANEEFENEKGGYESDDPEEGDEEEELLKDVEKPKSRKRKAPEKLRGSKKKKQRGGASGSVENDVFIEKKETGNLTEKKSLSSEEKKDDSDAEDNVENIEGTVKLSGRSCVPLPDLKRNGETQENGKETEDGELVPEKTEKTEKRNWKEDQAKTKRKNVDGESKRQKKWKKHQTDAEKKEGDDEPKGLLHWKQSPQENWGSKSKKHHQRNQKSDFFKHSIQNGDVQEQTNKKNDVLEQPTQKLGDADEQPGQNSGGVQEQSKQNCELSNQDNDDENEVVPIIIRPGYIRFEPLGEEQAVQQSQTPSETFQWNGITSKKKGQQWGKEDRPFTPRNNYKKSNKEYYEIPSNDIKKQGWENEDRRVTPQKEYKSSNNECSEILSDDKEKQPDAVVDFEKLPLLTSIPKEGDLVAYRILELSSTWTPEISSYRVGKVLWFKAESNQIMLVPVPEYPIVPDKADEDEAEAEAVQLDNDLYKEDGSLEIDFSALIDVRVFKNGSPEPATEALNQSNEGSVGNDNTAITVLPSSNDKQTDVPRSETGGENIWDELGEALSAKKEQLSKENGWGPWAKTPKKVQPTLPPPEKSWCKNGKKVQPSPKSGSGKNAQKVQLSQDSDFSKKKGTSGGKPCSYKGLRGGGLGSIMAILRSKNDT